jgi:hypothetical protein
MDIMFRECRCFSSAEMIRGLGRSDLGQVLYLSSQRKNISSNHSSFDELVFAEMDLGMKTWRTVTGRFHSSDAKIWKRLSRVIE